MEQKLCYQCFHPIQEGKPFCMHCGYPVSKGWGDHPGTLACGTLLNGRYLVGRVLGQDEFGISYRALDQQTNRCVTLKEYYPQSMSGRLPGGEVQPMDESGAASLAEGKNRFLSEAYALSQAPTPGKPRILNGFEDFGTAYVVMEDSEDPGPADEAPVNEEGARGAAEETYAAAAQGGYYNSSTDPSNPGDGSYTGAPQPAGSYPPDRNGGEALPTDSGNKKGNKKLLVILAAVLGLGLLVAAFFLFVHSYTEATCTEPSVCRFCKKENAPALGHEYMPATCTEPKTCKRCGATEGKALEHDYQPPTCLEPWTCSRCGATKGEPLGHDWKPATCTEPETCSRCGETRGEALGHKIGTEATCTEGPICSVCHEVVGDPLGHDWVDATYDEPKTCARCGKTEGTVLGYVPNVGGGFDSDKTISLSTKVHPYELDSDLENCFKIVLQIMCTEYSGSPFGTWYVYAENENGKWNNIGSFSWSSSDKSKWVEVELTLSNPQTIRALAINTPKNATYSISYMMYVDWAQCRVD